MIVEVLRAIVLWLTNHFGDRLYAVDYNIVIGVLRAIVRASVFFSTAESDSKNGSFDPKKTG